MTDQAQVEQDAQRIAAVSPEGRPAHPEAGIKTIVVCATVIAVVVLAVALVLALTVSVGVGFGVGVAGLVLGIITNTAIWVSLLRARERDQVR